MMTTALVSFAEQGLNGKLANFSFEQIVDEELKESSVS
jgi:hypothetical protein